MSIREASSSSCSPNRFSFTLKQLNRIIIILFSIFLCCSVSTTFSETTSHYKKKHTLKHTKKPIKKNNKSHHIKHYKKKNHVKHLPQIHNHIPTNTNPYSVQSMNPKSFNHELATINLTSFNSNFPNNMKTSVKKDMVTFVEKTVDNLHYSSYKLGGKHFDAKRGVYIVDCSNFVDHILQKVYPNAYSNLVNSVGADTPATQHYFNFFKELSSDSDNYWNKISDVDQLQPGDILVFRYKNLHGSETGGHVMVVMDKPERASDVFFVRVADSAPSRHSQDTRHLYESGIGIGTLLLKANPLTGKPSAYAWGINGYWNKNVKFAMARPMGVA